MASFYDFTLTKANGEELKTADLKGKVVMVVNTATGCGFTPHYEPIENMYRNYHEKGLEILDIPCNQFGHQTPGSDEEIHEFCTLHYNTTFDQMKKSDVNGANELPLYTFLKSQKGFEGFGKGITAMTLNAASKKMAEASEPNDIKWNFTKFIINRDGEVVKRFEPTTDMKEVEAFTIGLL
ncbi:MAG: glutathione peroxidase [Erysipelotrichaceae bacterium]|nr:glutathione peroxidase [Erysipelotrichaceae bacterium]MBO7697691.1 glutathione peroxidase [Erysipelotrichaceae bacterium]MBP5279551.1 glutathione peroxidase [Erysipelotrichaceae bacterium]